MEQEHGRGLNETPQARSGFARGGPSSSSSHSTVLTQPWLHSAATTSQTAVANTAAVRPTGRCPGPSEAGGNGVGAAESAASGLLPASSVGSGWPHVSMAFAAAPASSDASNLPAFPPLGGQRVPHQQQWGHSRRRGSKQNAIPDTAMAASSSSSSSSSEGGGLTLPSMRDHPLRRYTSFATFNHHEFSLKPIHRPTR